MQMLQCNAVWHQFCRSAAPEYNIVVHTERPTDTHKYTQCALIDVYAHTAQYTTKKKKNPCKKYSKHLLRQPMLSPFIESGCTHTIECSLHKINCNRSIARTILNRTISGRYEIRVELSSAIGTDN